ncbi:MAG: helix-turn-helix domain-containing protein [Candidatus Omnitrophica bacterium]|nr:helix-turn-helix domain-containing protein [Candidatus Omnitrophota bacterium]
MQTDDIWTLKEVAQFLKLSPLTVYRLTQKGAIPAVKVGSQWRYLKVNIQNLMKMPKKSNANTTRESA